PETLTVHLLAGPDIGIPTQDLLREFVGQRGSKLRIHTGLEEMVDDLPVMDRIPTTMWYRVLLPELLPDVDRVLYLDADTIVASELQTLWATPLDGAYLAAVSNVFEPGMEGHAAAVGIDDSTTYFNSGVLLLNLAEMRSDRCSDAILACARNRPLLWPDQDALNLVLGRRCVLLHPRWNCMNTLFFGRAGDTIFGAERVVEATSNPGVIHFEGPGMAKPWHYLNRHPRRGDYFAHRRTTPWPTVDIEGRTVKHRVLRLLPTRTANRMLRMEYQMRRRWARS
ncbi:MAG: glycosyltransferase family 8 protein, partial [Frankiaceae bacterium]|nr:glycosyltransferase family 8 protein [Frankiaceae bacterium]